MLDLNSENNVATTIRHNYRDYIYEIWSESNNIYKNFETFITKIEIGSQKYPNAINYTYFLLFNI